MEPSAGASCTRTTFGEEESFLAGESAGRFSAENSPSICARSMMLVVDRSLIQRTATGRYEVHELLRQYAAERLRAEKLRAEKLRAERLAQSPDFWPPDHAPLSRRSPVQKDLMCSPWTIIWLGRHN